MKLKYYLKRARISEKSFADRVGVHQSTMHRYVTGELEPSFKVLRKIFLESDQEVEPNDFIL
jgi:transcriptional regulator with XRE-family HTH domain